MNRLFTVFVGIVMSISSIVGVVVGWFLGCVILLLKLLSSHKFTLL